MNADPDLDKVLDHALALGRVRRMLSAPDELRAIRERAGITQEQLALAVGVSRSALQRWEAGQRSPRRLHLATYAQALKRIADASADHVDGDPHHDERPAGRPGALMTAIEGDRREPQ